MDPQTNPSSVGQVVNNQAVINAVANLCHAKPGAFEKGISTQAVASGASTKGNAAAVNPLVKVSVQSKKGKVAACAANELAAKVVKALGIYPAAKIANLKAQIASDNEGIKTINNAIAQGSLSDTDKLLLQTTLRSTRPTRPPTRSCSCWRRRSSRRTSSPRQPRTRSRRAAAATRS